MIHVIIGGLLIAVGLKTIADGAKPSKEGIALAEAARKKELTKEPVSGITEPNATIVPSQETQGDESGSEANPD